MDQNKEKAYQGIIEDLLALLDHADPNGWANGVLGPDGYTDEGVVRALKMLDIARDNYYELIGEKNPRGPIVWKKEDITPIYLEGREEEKVPVPIPVILILFCLPYLMFIVFGLYWIAKIVWVLMTDKGE